MLFNDPQLLLMGKAVPLSRFWCIIKERPIMLACWMILKCCWWCVFHWAGSIGLLLRNWQHLLLNDSQLLLTKKLVPLSRYIVLLLRNWQHLLHNDSQLLMRRCILLSSSTVLLLRNWQHLLLNDSQLLLMRSEFLWSGWCIVKERLIALACCWMIFSCCWWGGELF